MGQDGDGKTARWGIRLLCSSHLTPNTIPISTTPPSLIHCPRCTTPWPMCHATLSDESFDSLLWSLVSLPISSLNSYHLFTEMENLQSSNDSSSSSVREMINGSHRYTVKGYSLFVGMGVGKYISSDVFRLGGYDWSIRFYPDGFDHDSMQYVSVYLALVSKEAEVRAALEFYVLDHTGTQFFTNGSTKNCAYKFDSKTKPTVGCRQFIQRTDITSSLRKGDCLVILCKIGVLRSSKERRKAFPITIPPTNLGKCFKGFLDSGNATDVVFKIGDEAFKAHKQILAARSPVFQAQFYGPLANSTATEIIVEDIPEPVFQALLDFIYSDSLPNLNELGSSSCSSMILVQHLLAAADLYGLERLKLLCQDKLSEELTADTVVSTLGLADQHNCPHLKQACMNFISSHKNLKELINSEGFQHLEKSPALLMELLKVIASDNF